MHHFFLLSIECTVAHNFYIALHLVTPLPPVCQCLRLSSCRCLLLSALTGCCIATSASSCATTTSHPPGLTPLFIFYLLLLPPTSLSPAVKVDWWIVFSIFWMGIAHTVVQNFYVVLHLISPLPPVCQRFRLSSRHCLLSSALTGCCIAASASPHATGRAMA